ncbi:MAG TPA: hypothetical protein VGI39_35125 [Polyangiaceae bacterium]
MKSLHRLAIVGTPVVAIATVAIGLRVGAHDPVHAAIVYAAPRARGASALAWQVVTLVDDRGVRETERRKITVHARAAHATGGPKEATWSGETNEDGVAEAALDLPGLARGEPIDLEVTAEGVHEPLARGRADGDDAAWMNSAPGPFARASKREGAIAIDVAVLGGRLTPRVPVPLWIRATSRADGHPIAGATIQVEPEPGLDVTPSTQTTCPVGWARFSASPVMFTAQLSVHARTPDGRSGEWFGATQVVPGALAVNVEEPIKAGAPLAVALHAATVRPAYVEVDDDEGRAVAAIAELAPEGGGAQGTVTLPALTPGLKWLVASSEPRGAETLEAATRAIPILVPGSPLPASAPNPSDACAVGAYLAMHPAGSFRRWVALDGFVGRAATNAARRKRGQAIALLSLAAASLLELLLLLSAARRGAAFADDLEEARTLAPRKGLRSMGQVAIGILAALLGFGLLAALVLARA